MTLSVKPRQFKILGLPGSKRVGIATGVKWPEGYELEFIPMAQTDLAEQYEGLAKQIGKSLGISVGLAAGSMGDKLVEVSAVPLPVNQMSWLHALKGKLPIEVVPDDSIGSYEPD